MSSHTCPGPECAAEVPAHMLACPRHWYQVPRPIRIAIWRAWRADPGGPEHTRLLGLAIRNMRP